MTSEKSHVPVELRARRRVMDLRDVWPSARSNTQPHARTVSTTSWKNIESKTISNNRINLVHQSLYLGVSKEPSNTGSTHAVGCINLRGGSDALAPSKALICSPGSQTLPSCSQEEIPNVFNGTSWTIFAISKLVVFAVSCCGTSKRHVINV